ncbi:hypothetical protein GYMLUDRAFT_980664 [Collybiopsis luxurians FD-317 M1]|nr:hypothetical protein GYMLUDRAFT_980664 [Collybiopsis luxurians FD-317 M1]
MNFSHWCIQTNLSNGLFRLPTLNRWIIVATSPETIEDLYHAPNGELSSYAAFDELVQLSHTLGPSILENPYHMPLFSSLLTKRLDELCPAIFEEIEYAFRLQLSENLSSLNGSKFIEDMVLRISNRIFVGKPLCRDKNFLEIVSFLTFKMALSGFIIGGTPVWLRSCMAFLISSKRTQKRLCKLLIPVIAQKQQIAASDYSSLPLDFLGNLVIMSSRNEKQSEMDLTLRILHVNFAGLLSTSTVALFVLNHIASRLDWQQELFHEIQQIVEQEGWSFAALSRMEKVDSIVKEVIRYHHFSSITLGRKVQNKNFKFSNGVSVPSGSLLYAASQEVARHHFGPDFNPFQFCSSERAHKKSAVDSSTTTSPKFLAWGHGRHACPGRYFAVCQIKAIIANLIYHYQVAIKDQKIPKNRSMSLLSVPDRNLDITFQRRI